MTTAKWAKATIKRRRIGALLRHYREACNPKILSKQAAHHIGADPVLLGRIERGEYRIKPLQIEALLDLYGIEDRLVHDELRRAAMEPLDSGWWYPFRTKLSPSFLDFVTLENEATEILSVAPAGIPGLLQCMSYAQEIQETDPSPSIRQDADLYVQVRLSRQQAVLRTRDPAKLRCVMSESSFYSSSRSMADQIGTLLSLSERDNITIRVVPMDAPVGAQISVQSNILKFRSPWPTTMRLTTLGYGVMVDDQETTKRSEQLFCALEEDALPADGTRDFLEERLKKIHHEH